MQKFIPLSDGTYHSEYGLFFVIWMGIWSTNIFITFSPLRSALRTTLLDVCNVCGQFSTRLPQQPFYFPAQRSERNNSNNYATAILPTHKSFETEAETLKLSLNHRSRQHSSIGFHAMYSIKLSWYLLDHINRYCFSWWQGRVMVEKGLGIWLKLSQSST